MRCSPGISPRRSTRSSYSISSSTPISRSRSSASTRRSCSSSGSSSSTSARRSSSIAAASWRRCARGIAARPWRLRPGAGRAGGPPRPRPPSAQGTARGSRRRRRAGSSGAGAARCGGRDGPWRSPSRSARRVDVAQGDVAHRSRRRSCDRGSALISTSPGRGLNGLKSTSQLLNRAPSPASVEMRLALTKMRRRCTSATKPTTRGSRPLGAGHGDDVVDPSDRRAAGIEQRQSHHAEGVDELGGHRTEASCGWLPLEPRIPPRRGRRRACRRRRRHRPSR